MRRLSLPLILLIVALLLSACGTGNSQDSATPASQPNGSSGEVNLSWIAPSTRTNGSYIPVSALGGYRVYMGTSRDTLDQIVELRDGDITSYTVKNLPAGRSYYFAISVYDSDGLESDLSQVIRVSAG